MKIEMKSIPAYEIISKNLGDLNWSPKPYSYANWLKQKLLDMGFTWVDDSAPHFCLQASYILITISPYPNIVIVSERNRSFTSELYCHDSIPQNEDEFEVFWQQLKPKLK